MGLRDLLETLSKSSEEPQRVGVREAVAEVHYGLSTMSWSSKMVQKYIIIGYVDHNIHYNWLHQLRNKKS